MNKFFIILTMGILGGCNCVQGNDLFSRTACTYESTETTGFSETLNGENTRQ